MTANYYLVRYGAGTKLFERSRTQIKAAGDVTITGWLYKWDRKRGRWVEAFARQRDVDQSDIITAFDHEPTPAEVRQARQQLRLPL